ncbi:MAG: pyridoxal 5'-phosphate synthase glutaminase subunit PdxT [Desulfurococcus sp.]|jgi:5'-phosphate synthase pdxT subunit|uniref:pyridoxal 5'-phosphate synthase glutaminase subunit PdxT n=1 Tax=Desulfurococcus sp. TaxID=51678 RepID=UPI00315E5749
MVKIGILALQGDYLEHYQVLKSLGGVEPVIVKHSRELSYIDALIIPGGESTTIGSLIESRGLSKPLVEFMETGKPVLGTCAGAILLAKEVADRVVGETKQYTLRAMNIRVMRNAYGRQRESFIATVNIEDIGEVRAAFIRAPIILEAREPARITGYLNDSSLGRHGVAALERNLYAVTFHPEITGDIRLYNYIIQQAKR